MALRTKQIIRLPEPDDGLRISIMSRHTLNDGVTPNPAITPALFDKWWPELAPPDKLIGWYYKQEQPPTREVWDIFEREFINHLASKKPSERLCYLINLARTCDVTLLCIEPTPEHCHRRLVATMCKCIDPHIETIIE